MSCTCNTPQTRTMHCFNEACSNTETVEVGWPEKKIMCAVHRHGFAFCGHGSGNFFLCEKCQADGYTMVEGIGSMFGPTYVLRKDSK